MKFLLKKFIFAMLGFASLPVFADGWIAVNTPRISVCGAGGLCTSYPYSFHRNSMLDLVDKYNLVLKEMLFQPTTAENTSKINYAFKLAGYQLRHGVFMLQSYATPQQMEVIDFSLPSVKEAQEFCEELRRVSAFSDTATSLVETPVLSILPITKVIAVGVGVKADGISADKHYFCPNPQAWVPGETE